MKKIYSFVLFASFVLFGNIVAKSQEISFSVDVDYGCSPLMVTFTNTSTVGAAYVWNFGYNENFYYAHDTVITFDQGGTYTVLMFGVDSAGQVIDYFDHEITVEGTYFNMSTGNVVCPGTKIFFSTGGDYDWLEWDFDNGNIVTDEWNIAQTFFTPGVYNVSLTAEGICGIETVTEAIVVNPNAVPMVEAVVDGSDWSCAGDPVYFKSNYEESSYFWNFDDGYTSMKRNPHHKFQTLGSKMVTLTVTNSCGNSATDSVVIHVATGIEAEAGFTVYPQPVCPGQLMGFYAWGAGDFEWSFGDEVVGFDREPRHMYADTGSYLVTLMVTNGCGDSDTSSQYVSIESDPTSIPNVYIYFEGGDNWMEDTVKFCIGEEVKLKNLVFDEDNMVFTWDMGDGTVYEGKDVSHAYNSTGIFQVSMVARNNCNGTDTLYRWVDIDPTALPEVALLTIPTNICPGEKVYFIDDNNNIELSDYSYSIWFGDGDSLINQTSYNEDVLPVISHIYTDEGTYTFTFAATNLCGNSETYTDIIVVQTNPLAETEYYIENTTEGGEGLDHNNPACPGDEVLFLIAGGSFYEWHFGDGGTSTEHIPRHAYADTGNYEAFCIATNACGRVDTIFTNVSISDTILPLVWFEMSQDVVCAGDSVHFTYPLMDFLSVNSNLFFWDFDDGNVSYEENPVHAYENGGDYFVKLVVTNGCTSDSVFRHVLVANPEVDISVDQNGISPGTTVNFQNQGNGGVSFFWDFGDGTTSTAVSPSHTYATYGVYDVTLSAISIMGCETVLTKEAFIFVHNMQIANEVIHDVYCYGMNNGFIDIAITGGNPPYSYVWNDGVATQDRYQLSPGFFAVTVYDDEGVHVSAQYQIDQPDQLNGYLYIEPEICGGDGYAEAGPWGGTSPYMIEWSNGETGLFLVDLPAGEYSGTITDALGCKESNIFEILSNPNPLVVNIPYPLTNTACNTSNGIASVNVSGGSGDYSIWWDDPAEQTTTVATGLAAGAYMVWVDDNINGCSDSAFAFIQNFGGPTINYSAGGGLWCNNGDNGVLLASASGAGPLSYEWNTIPPSYDSLVNGVMAGTYFLTITDINGCNTSYYAEVNNPDPIMVQFEYENPKCFGSYDGFAIAHILNMDTARYYFYNWSNGEIDSLNQNRNAGTYTVTVSDNYGCSVVEQITLTNPPAIQLDVFSSDVTFYGANNGVIDITVSYGSPPFNYEWSNGSNTQDLIGLGTGVYMGTITDSKGCHVSGQITINQPVPLNVSIIANGPTTFCNGGSVTLDAGPGYDYYHWSTGELTQSIVADANMTYAVYVANSLSYGIDSMQVNVIQPFDGQEICLVTVDHTDGYNLIVWEKTEDVGIVSFNIYKESTSANQYILIGNVPFDDPSIFTDSSSNPAQQSDRYKISVIDTCGNESELSSEHKTMHLTVSTGIGVYNLIWENYEGFDFGSYVIYRGTSQANLMPIGTIQSNLTTYSDFQPSGLFYYQIGIMKEDTCLLDTTGLKSESGPYSSSFSNLEDNGVDEDLIMAGFSAMDTVIYVGNSAGFFSTSSGNPNVYSWTFEGGNPSSYSGESPPPVQYSVAGVYDVSLTVSDGIDTSVFVRNDYINVTYNTDLGVDFIASPRYFTEKPFNVAFDNQSAGGTNYNYIWDFGDGNTSTQFQPFHTYLDSGLYTVSLIAVDPTNSISDTLIEEDYILCISGTSVEEVGYNNGDLAVYPNPFGERTTVEFDNHDNSIYTLIITDITGKLIRKTTDIRAGKIEIDRADMADGVYFVELRGSKLYKTRIIVR